MIADFVERLTQTEGPACLFNPYVSAEPWGAVKQGNLQLYLQHMQCIKPSYLLVGEALGYRGGRLTGVPFTSEAILLQHPWFGLQHGYQKTTEWPGICREATATILWQTIDQLNLRPLLWNACPFHPFQPEKPASNQAPTQAEIQLGRTFVQDLCEMFPSVTAVIAVGNKASKALGQWQIPHHKIRHPSHGGKKQFQQGLRLLQEQYS